MSRVARTRVTLVLALAAVGVGAAQAQGAHVAPQDAPTLALTGATLIDGTDAEPRHDMTVLVEEGRIAAVFPSAERALPDPVQVIDLEGRYLIPGLINTHIHLPMMGWSRDSVATGLERMLRSGVTTVREMAGDARLAAELDRASIVEGAPFPEIHWSVRMAGPAFYQQAASSGSWAGHEAGRAPWAQAVDTETDLALAVARAAGTGAAGLKLYRDLDAAVVRGLVDEAHRQGMQAWAHGTVFPATPLELLRAGVDGLAHVCLLFFGMGPEGAGVFAERTPIVPAEIDLEDEAFQELVGEMRERRVVVDATARNAALGPWARNAGCSPELMHDALRRIHEAGIPISTGTDYHIDEGEPDPTLFTEIEYLVESGVLSPAEAITAATLNGARAIGIESSHGSIEPGKVADLVVLAGDPTQRIAALRDVVEVIKQGERVLAWARDSSDAHADTLRYQVLNHGRPAGTMEVVAVADTTVVRSHRWDRGDETDATTRYVADESGTFLRLEAHRGDEPDPVERFTLVGDTARWRTATDSGAAAVDGPAFYWPDVYHEFNSARLATFLLAQPQQEAELLPFGESASARVAVDTVVPLDGRAERVRLVVMDVPAFAPYLVWLDAEDELFASDAAWLTTVRAGAESALPVLRSLERRVLAERSEALARRLTTPALARWSSGTATSSTAEPRPSGRG